MLSNNFSRLGVLTAALVFAALPISCGKKPAATTGEPAATDSNPTAAEPASKPTGAVVTLSGAGATFPQPLYERYSKEIKKDLPQIKINYQGIGSGLLDRVNRLLIWYPPEHYRS